MDIGSKMKEYQNIINKELENVINKEDCPEKKLNESMKYSLLAGGKRIRPILVLETYKLFENDFKECMPYAIAIEMIHNFSLIHDDLPGIDNDDFRHGKPTNHKKFNEATAILAGDGLLNGAYYVIGKDLRETTDRLLLDRKIEILNEFSYAIDRMIIGEYVDTEFENKNISEEYLEYNYKNKTGAIIRLCVRVGAILGKCSEEELQKLTIYSEKIGLAFQVKDDLLSVIGDEKIMGKPVGNDERRGKSTYVSKYGLEQAKNKLEELTKEAVEALESFGEKAKFLKGLAYYIKDRNK